MLVERGPESEQTLLSFDDGSYLLDPDISPDGNWIAFIRQAPATRDATGQTDFGSDLFVSDLDGKNRREVVRHSRVGEFIRNPVWLNRTELLINVRGRAPDGSPDPRIETIDLASGRRVRIVDDALEIGVSPDRRSIAYVSVADYQQHLMVAELRTGRLWDLTPPGGSLSLISSIVWAPNGSTIAFAAADASTSRAPGGNASRVLPTVHPTLQDIWLVHKDGHNLRRLVEVGESPLSLAWSGDSRAIYVLGLGGLRQVDVASGFIDLMAPNIELGQIRLMDD